MLTKLLTMLTKLTALLLTNRLSIQIVSKLCNQKKNYINAYKFTTLKYCKMIYIYTITIITRNS